MDFLSDGGIKLFTYKFSLNKSLIAEGTIRLIRESLGNLRRQHGDAAIKWHRVLPNIIDEINSRPITIDGKRMTFAPKDITADNFHQFQNELNEKLDYYSIMGYNIDTSILKYRYPLQTRVKIKKRALIPSGSFTKFSQAPLDDVVWIIIRRGAHLTKRLDILKTVFIAQEMDPKVTLQIEEAALVRV